MNEKNATDGSEKSTPSSVKSKAWQLSLPIVEFILTVCWRLTLPRMLLAGFWIFCGLIGADALVKPWGIAGRIGGFIMGAAVGIIVSWALIYARVRLFFPMPVCCQGKCRSFDDYTYQKWTFYGWEGWGVYHYKCHCGDEYVLHGKRLGRVLPDGTIKLCKKRIGLRKWEDQKE